jgi:hypothetical protein
VRGFSIKTMKRKGELKKMGSHSSVKVRCARRRSSQNEKGVK